jgi:hypothetical protein
MIHDVFNELIYVEWFDAVAECEWSEVKKAEAHPCRSMGFIVAETDDVICIASTVSFKESNAKIHIPKGWITKTIRFGVSRITRARRVST